MYRYAIFRIYGVCSFSWKPQKLNLVNAVFACIDIPLVIFKSIEDIYIGTQCTQLNINVSKLLYFNIPYYQHISILISDDRMSVKIGHTFKPWTFLTKCNSHELPIYPPSLFLPLRTVWACFDSMQCLRATCNISTMTRSTIARQNQQHLQYHTFASNAECDTK